MHEVVCSDGRTILTDRRYQNAGVQMTLRPGDPPVHAYHIEYDQWRRMVDSGILGKYDPCELLEGAIVGIPGPGSPQFYHVRHVLNDVLRKLLPEQMTCLQNPPLMLDTSEPMAELAIYRGSFDDYLKLDRFPRGDEIALVVEIGELALEMDRVVKQRIYAAAGIPEYWIVNLVEKKVEVYRHPAAATASHTAHYATLEKIDRDSEMLLALHGVVPETIVIADILS